MTPLPWGAATQQALYGERGFYRRAGTDEGPAAHFRTSVHVSPMFAEALLRLVHECDLTTVVDVGSGRGELLVQLHQLDPSLRLIGVDVAPRPDGLDRAIDWRQTPPAVEHALVVANEWLDNVPVDVVTLTATGCRTVLVDPQSGVETLGGAPSAADESWLRQWWPLRAPGDRAEVGRPRDEAWSGVIKTLMSGVAVMVDYAHDRHDRPSGGSLAGYRRGRKVRPVPDGTCDITSFVAVDACAAAGERAGARSTRHMTQRQALSILGVRAGQPMPQLSPGSPGAYLAALARHSQAAELTARAGYGSFRWLIQSVGIDLPAGFAAATEVPELGQL